MPQPRLLQATEIAGFLARHPATAARVAITRTAMTAGLYDYDYYSHAAEPWTLSIKFPGIIEPRGIQVWDSEFQRVTIEPTPSGLYFSGFSPAIGDIDKPGITPVPFNDNPLTDLAQLLKTIALGAALIYLGGKALEGRR